VGEILGPPKSPKLNTLATCWWGDALHTIYESIGLRASPATTIEWHVKPKFGCGKQQCGMKLGLLTQLELK